MNEQELYDLFIKLFKKVCIDKAPENTYEDRLYTAAHSLFMENCTKIESMYPYVSEFDNDGMLWYDFIREEMILKYAEMIDR